MSALNPHEFLGVVSARLVHRLSNYMAVIVGSVAIHDSARSTPADRAEAVAAIREATARAGILLDRFGELSRTLPHQENFCSVQQLLSLLGDWASARSWEFQVNADVGGKGALALAGPWKWLAFALDAIGLSSSGSLEVNPNAPGRQIPLRDHTPISYLTLVLNDSGPAIDWQSHRENLDNFELAAAYEILQTLGARPETKVLNANQRQTRISLPLVEVEQAVL